jgi:hypothetical protein
MYGIERGSRDKGGKEGMEEEDGGRNREAMEQGIEVRIQQGIEEGMQRKI